MNRTASPELVRQLVAALEAADLYLNSYDTSAPSRIKAETRGAVESAIGAVKAELAAQAAPSTITASDAVVAARVDFNNPTSLRDAGYKLLSAGYSTPFRTANYRAVHVRGNASNTTLCGKTLSEPNSSFPQGYLHNYKSCSACVRQLEASR